ncbi:sugar-binding protein [Paraflavitalea pollutisoli]|uniref:sugar-binding protein n=1 Tax=Paraflavitalea pollutisoli TaxID=3034143 RepID=UPI0023ED0815|nr:sugar-binding protein [Paraflavitalea sp. H1-2-19X]
MKVRTLILPKRLCWLPLLVLLAGCAHHATAPNRDYHDILDRVSKEYGIHDISYLITQNGRVAAEQFSSSLLDFSPATNSAIAAIFCNPLKLDVLVKDSILPGDSALKKYFHSIDNKGIQVKDLVVVPADNYEPQRFCADSVYWMTDRLVQAVAKKDQYANAFMGALDQATAHLQGHQSLLESLAQVSRLFDEKYIEYFYKADSLVANLFPTWYTENKTFFYGWKILKIQHSTILWNCFVDQERTLLLMKFMDKKVFAAIQYTAKPVPDPYSYHRDDLLQSPIALALIKPLLVPQAQQLDIDYTAAWSTIAENRKVIDNSAYRLLYNKELIARARYDEAVGDSANARKLYAGYEMLTGGSSLAAYLNEVPIAETGYISDRLNTTAAFSIDKDGNYQVFAGGQVLPVTDQYNAPYNADHVQLYFSQDDHVKAGQDPLQVFHFNYRYNKIAGMQDDRHADSWIKASNIRFAYGDPDDTSYVLEIAIPWYEMPGKKKFNQRPVRLNVLLGDCDYEENKRESILSWATKPGERWDDPATYGVLSFAAHPAAVRKGYASRLVSHPPVIDGQIDDVWDQVTYSGIEWPYQDRVSAYDHAGKFKSLYDESYVYFLFYVGDNCKNKTGVITKDKCWIEEAATNQLIWKMPADTTRYAPSYSMEAKIYLKAGKYKLRYYSDKGHSTEGWYAAPPQHDVYGGIIYPLKK